MNTPCCLAIAVVALVPVVACAKTSDPAPAARAERVVAPVAAKTPMDQSQSSAGVKITAEIRRAIMDDKTMSMNAQNCKVITDTSGLVTLRGVVNSQTEKDSIEAKAKSVSGVTEVDNQLDVKTA